VVQQLGMRTCIYGYGSSSKSITGLSVKWIGIFRYPAINMRLGKRRLAGTGNVRKSPAKEDLEIMINCRRGLAFPAKTIHS